MIIETKLIRKPAFLVVGMTERVQLGPGVKPSENAIAKLWDRFNERCCEIPHQVGGRSYGLIQQQPDMQPGDPFPYTAAVGVTEFGLLPDGMSQIEVPETLYAVVTYRGPIDGIGEGFEYFWRTWLPNADYAYEGKYEFEFYDQRYRNRIDEGSELDLYFPVVPKRERRGSSALPDGMTIGAIEPFRALAVRTPMTPDKSGTRTAWRKLTEAIPLDDPRWADTSKAYVFIPQAEWSKSVDTLWVGLAVKDFGRIPEGVEALDIPASTCVKARFCGDETHMFAMYDALFHWLDSSEEYELDTRPGVLGMEANRLAPVNPLAIPYEEVGTFDFDILYPVRRK